MAFSEYMNFKYLQYYHRKATKCHQRKWAMHRTLGIYINLFFFSLMLFGFSVFPSLPPLTQMNSAQPRSESPTFLTLFDTSFERKKIYSHLAQQREFNYKSCEQQFIFGKFKLIFSWKKYNPKAHLGYQRHIKSISRSQIRLNDDLCNHI